MVKSAFDSSQKSAFSYSTLALVLVLLAALGVRLYRLDVQSIWYDEGWSIHLARESLSNALRQAASPGHTHPPAYYLLLMLWERIWGHSVYAMRGLSVVMGVLACWGVWWTTRLFYGKRAALAAATLLALSPSHVIYSQETRMYALVVLWAVFFPGVLYRVLRGGQLRWRDWLLLLLIELGAVYTHYFAVLMVAAGVLWGAAVLFVERWRGNTESASRAGSVKHRLLCLLGVQFCVAIGLAPWLVFSFSNLAGYQAEGALSPRVGAFVREVWAFLIGGHIALLGRERVFAWLSMANLIAGGGLWTWLLLTDRKRDALALLSALWLLPVGLLLAIMQVRPGFHPRYALMALPPLIMLLARAFDRLWSARALPLKVAGLAWASLWLAAVGSAVWPLYTDHYYARDDARATAAALTEELPTGALVLVDGDDWALRYYMEGQDLRATYLQLDRFPRDVEQQLARILSGADIVALVKWHQGETDKRGLLPYLLEYYGTLVRRRRTPGYEIGIYRMDDLFPPTVSQQLRVDFGPLQLVDAQIQASSPADEAVTVALSWRKTGTIDRPLKVALKLVDKGGHEVAREDRWLRDLVGMTTDAWALTQEVCNYYVVGLYPGLAPVSYQLQVTVYGEDDPQGLDVLDAAGAPAGKAYDLATVELLPPGNLADRRIDTATLGIRNLDSPIEAAPGLWLEGVGIVKDRFTSGETLSCLLLWHASGRERLPDYAITLSLKRSKETLVSETSSPVYGLYPTAEWGPNQIVLDWRELTIPATVSEGEATVEIAVEGYEPVKVATVAVEAVARTFEPPHIPVPTALALGDLVELVGYDLSEPVVSNQPFRVVLYWKPRARTDVAYTVFVHLLDANGQLVAQHDGPPVGGQRPTTSWIAGEYIADEHVVVWRSSYEGRALLEVGLYDARTGERLATPDGDTSLALQDVWVVLMGEKGD